MSFGGGRLLGLFAATNDEAHRNQQSSRNNLLHFSTFLKKVFLQVPMREPFPRHEFRYVLHGFYSSLGKNYF
jgi:hypothetical protein